MINVTGIDLVKFAKKAYELSSPQGLGFLHFTPKPLSDEEAESLVRPDELYPLDMDYVRGRSIKLHVRKEDGKLLIDDSWYDHMNAQFKELLGSVGIEIDPTGKHGCACNCGDCRANRISITVLS